MPTPTLPRRPSGADSDIIRGPVHTRAIDVNTYTDIRGTAGRNPEKPTDEEGRHGRGAGESTTKRGRAALLQVYRPNIPVEIGEFCQEGGEIGARFKVSLFRAPRRAASVFEHTRSSYPRFD